jgi:tetratricopeptide (TPR) repeat protein
LLVDAAIIRDLDRAEKILEFVFENTNEYEPSLCSYADLFYKRGQCEKSVEIGLDIHKRAKKSSGWKDDPPPAPKSITGKAYRALAKKAKKEERRQEAIEYFEKLKSLDVATENDLKILNKLKEATK